MKALTLSLCILALLGSGASGFFWWQVGNQKQELQTRLSSEQTRANGLQSELAQTTETLEATKVRLLAESTELGDTKTKLTAAEARNVQVSREVAALKTNLATKEETEKKLSGELDNLRRDLVQTRLAAQVGSPEEVERYKLTIASLESRLAVIQSGGSVEDMAAVSPAGPTTPAMSERTAAARVASVGTKDAFVVLELGAADGINVGDKFLITRVGQAVAESVISEVKETFAIAQIAPSSIKSPLKAGDIASYSK